jgi:hypothetical protein
MAYFRVRKTNHISDFCFATTFVVDRDGEKKEVSLKDN